MKYPKQFDRLKNIFWVLEFCDYILISRGLGKFLIYLYTQEVPWSLANLEVFIALKGLWNVILVLITKASHSVYLFQKHDISNKSFTLDKCLTFVMRQDRRKTLCFFFQFSLIERGSINGLKCRKISDLQDIFFPKRLSFIH